MLLKLRCFWETDHNIKISRTIVFTINLGLRCFWETQPRQLVDEKLTKIKIQFIQNEIHFKERFSTKQNLMKWSKSCLTRLKLCILLLVLFTFHTFNSIVDLQTLFVQIAAHSFNYEFCTHKLKGFKSSSRIIVHAYINHYDTKIITK